MSCRTYRGPRRKRNTAILGRGGGFANIRSLTLRGSLVSGNTAANGPEIYSGGYFGRETLISNYSLFGHDGNAGVSGFTPGANDIVPSESLAAILGSLAANGGSTQTHALVANSPAVDRVGAGCPPPVADQRGVMRPVDGDGDFEALCDIGAFEMEVPGAPSACDTVAPSDGCTVNGVPNQSCEGTGGNDTIVGTTGKR